MSKGRALIGLVLGSLVALAISVAALADPGYVVAYWLLLALAVGILLLCLAGAAWPARRTRALTVPLAVAALSIPLLTFGGTTLAASLGYWAEPMVSFGPDVLADLVVIFRQEAADQQIFQFDETVIGRPHPVRGTSLLDSITSVAAVNVAGHRGYALQLREDSSASESRRLKEMLQQQPLVLRVLEDVVPSQIPLEPSSAVSPNPSLQRTPPG
jgi:hypothetical protein